MSRTVGEGVCVGHSTFTAGHGGVDDRFPMVDFGTAAVGHGRDSCRGNGHRQAIDGITSVFCCYAEVFRHHVVSVTPSVVGAIDGVGVDKGGVTAAVGNIAGVDAFLERNIRAAVGNDGQGGGVDFRDTMNISSVVGDRGKSCRVQGVSESPGGVVSGTVGVAVTEDHSSGAIAVEGCGAVHEDRSDAVATDVLNDLCCWTADIGHARYGSVTVARYSGNSFRQDDVEGE